jgi:hypothetical protein
MEIIESIESENPLQFLEERGNQRLSKPLHCCEILALNQRATCSTPVRPTNTINDLGRSRQDSLFHKSVIDLFLEIAQLSFPMFHQRV